MFQHTLDADMHPSTIHQVVGKGCDTLAKKADAADSWRRIRQPRAHRATGKHHIL